MRATETADEAVCLVSSRDDDELLDELDATIHQLGRLFTSRHGMCDLEDAEQLSGPRLLALHLVSHGEPRRVSDIAAQLGIKAPAASSLIDGLVEAGLAERESDPDDRRATRIAITELGQVRLHQMEEHRRALMRRYSSVLSDDDIRNLIRIHRLLIDGMTSERI